MGAGKTLVARVFESLRVPVFYADVEANKLSESDPSVVAGIKKLFGDDAYVDGKYNRKHVASKIFNDQTLLAQLNAVIHPATFRQFAEWVIDKRDAPYVMKEAAILFESGADKTVDKIIFVSAPESVRMERVQKRNPVWSGVDIKRRMQTQEPEESKISRSDYVIQNDGTAFLLPQVLSIHRSLLGKSEAD